MKAGRKLNWAGIQEKALNLDLFGIPLKFNIAGKQNVPSGGGLALTILMFMIVIAFASSKLQILINKLNPNITQVTMLNFFDSKYTVNLDDLDFKFAWGVESTYGDKPLQDTNYIRWVAEIALDGNDAIDASKQLAFHICTDKDYDDFY